MNDATAVKVVYVANEEKVRDETLAEIRLMLDLKMCVSMIVS